MLQHNTYYTRAVVHTVPGIYERDVTYLCHVHQYWADVSIHDHVPVTVHVF